MKTPLLQLPIAACVLVGYLSSMSLGDERTVQVTGTSVARVVPDEVTWSIQINNRNERLPEAREANDKGVQQVLELARKLGVQQRDLQTSYLSIDKVYHRDNRGNQGDFRHYFFRRSVTLKQKDLTKFDETLKQLSEIESIEASYQLSTSKYHDIRRKTRLDAVRVARDKAKEMTELLDANLGRVVSIDALEKANPGYGSNRFSNNAVFAVADATPDSVEGTFAPGAIEIRVSVDITFEIE